MKSRILQKIKTDLKNLIKNKEIIDIIVFGSLIKGKSEPSDIDIALITEKQFDPKIKNYHISTISPIEFFKNPPTLANTLLREGYSIKQKKYLSETFNFQNRTLFTYKLSNLSPSKKVKIVNLLRGKNKQQGLVERYKGDWLANQTFTMPITSTYIIEQFLINFSIKFKKYFILIH